MARRSPRRVSRAKRISTGCSGRRRRRRPTSEAMADEQGRIQIRDSTLREGLDTPGVAFSDEQKRKILRALEEAGVSECEVVAPSRVRADLEFVKAFRREGSAVRLTGLVYAYGDEFD